MKKIFFYFCLFLSSKILCTDYPGSGTDKPLEIYMNRVILYGGDCVGQTTSGETPPDVDVLGLVWFAGGIDVQAGGGNYVMFSSPFPVGKSIALNDSDLDWLVLMEDFHLSSSVNLLRSGAIEAKYGSIILNGPFNLMGNRITFVGGASPWYPNFNGKGNILDFSDGGQLNVRVTLMEMNSVYLKNLTNNSINFSDTDLDAATLTFTNSIIKLGGNVCFNHDIVVSDGELFITGTGHTICFNKKLEVKNGATLKMDYGTTFSLGYRGYIKTSGTGVFHFNGCDIEIGENYGSGSEINNGFYLKNGRALFQNRVGIGDDSNHKHFTIGEHSDVRFLANSRVLLDGTTTFSLL